MWFIAVVMVKGFLRKRGRKEFLFQTKFYEKFVGLWRFVDQELNGNHGDISVLLYFYWLRVKQENFVDIKMW